MTKRVRRKLISLGLGFLILGAGTWLNSQPNIQKTLNPVTKTPAGYYSVSSFVDGDTIAVNMDGKTEKVRFIGVDTPETHKPNSAVQCFGEAAAAYTKKLIGQNAVRLEADPTNSNRDRYQRLLRYVYLPDNRLVNAEIIKNGYGFAYVSFPFTKLDEFRAYEQQARDANIGLWGGCVVRTISGNREQTNDAP